MYIHRQAEEILQMLLKQNKPIILLGARQVGKTTLIEHTVGQNSRLLNMDIDVDKQMFLAASKLFPVDALKSLENPDILVIDEAQRMADVGRIIKGWYDKRLPVKIILSGSSSLDLLDQSSESLTGRNEKLYLPPLLFWEVIKSQEWYRPEFSGKIIENNFNDQIKTLVMQRMVYGSYPEAVTSDNQEKYLINLIADYLLKDVLQSGMVKNQDIIKKLLMLLAYQTGSLVSVNELANNLQIARQTVESYLYLLEQTCVIFRLPSYSTNQRKELAKSTKIYFWDTGVRNGLLKAFLFSDLRPDIGQLWENWVVAEIAKKNMLGGNLCNLYFWRTSDGSEVDLVIQGSKGLSAYEIKWQKHAGHVRSFTGRYGVEVKTITRDNFPDMLASGM